MKAYLNVTSLSVPGWPPGSASSRLQVVQNKKLFDIHEIYLVYNILTNFHEDPIIRSTQKSLLTPHFCLFFLFFPFCGVVNVEVGEKNFIFTKYILI